MREIEREASRLLVITPEHAVLLLHVAPSFRDAFWVTPGGGLDPGETFEQAAIRELREEVGRDDLSLGPWIWSRYIEFTWEDWYVRQHDRTFLIEVPEAFEAQIQHPDEEPIIGAAWFSPDELSRMVETVYPEDLATLIEQLRRDGSPPMPVRLPDRIEGIDPAV